MKMLLIALTFACTLATDALADFTYTYTGNPYNTYTRSETGTPQPWRHVGGGGITGSFILSELPVDSTTLRRVTPEQYGFSDGFRTLWSDPAHYAGSVWGEFYIATTNGVITDWRIYLHEDTSQYDFWDVYDMYFSSSLDSSRYDYYQLGAYGSKYYLIESGYVSNAPGQWTYSFYTAPTPTPVPAAVWLLGSGLIGLLGIRRKLRG